jgi:hypothetical protein
MRIFVLISISTGIAQLILVAIDFATPVVAFNAWWWTMFGAASMLLQQRIAKVQS